MRNGNWQLVPVSHDLKLFALAWRRPRPNLTTIQCGHLHNLVFVCARDPPRQEGSRIFFPLLRDSCFSHAKPACLGQSLLQRQDWHSSLQQLRQSFLSPIVYRTFLTPQLIQTTGCFGVLLFFTSGFFSLAIPRVLRTVLATWAVYNALVPMAILLTVVQWTSETSSADRHPELAEVFFRVIIPNAKLAMNFSPFEDIVRPLKVGIQESLVCWFHSSFPSWTRTSWWSPLAAQESDSISCSTSDISLSMSACRSAVRPAQYPTRKRYPIPHADRNPYANDIQFMMAPFGIGRQDSAERLSRPAVAANAKDPELPGIPRIVPHRMDHKATVIVYMIEAGVATPRPFLSAAMQPQTGSRSQ